MTITVQRMRKTQDGIFGKLSLDWAPFTCYTVENLLHAITPGVYTVEFTWSPEFNMITPLLDVPGRTAIRIHPANWPKQLLGCIAVGDKEEPDAIDNSRITYGQLVKLLNQQAGMSIHVVDVSES